MASAMRKTYPLKRPATQARNSLTREIFHVFAYECVTELVQRLTEFFQSLKIMCPIR